MKSAYHSLIEMIQEILLVKGSVQQKLRPMLLYVIRKLFSRPIINGHQIYILLKGQFAMYIKQFSVNKAGSRYIV